MTECRRSKEGKMYRKGKYWAQKPLISNLPHNFRGTTEVLKVHFYQSAAAKEESLWMHKVTREADSNSNINAGNGGKDESKEGLSITDKNHHRQSGLFKWLVVTRLWFAETQRAQKIGHLAHTIAGCLLTHYNPSADSFAWHLSAAHLAALPPHLQWQLRVCLLQILNKKANITILIFLK